jgi:long-subunit fatty acid transport protein
MPRYFANVLRLASIAIVLAAGVARAGGFAVPEVGLRETAMGAVIGRPDDGSAIYHNPAGLVLSGGWHLYLSSGLASPRTELRLAPWDQSDRFLGATAESDGYYAPVTPSRAFAVIPMIAVTGELMPHQLYGGIGIFVGNATGAAFPEDSITRYHLIDGYVVAPQMMAAAAYQLRPDLALGAAVGVVNLRVHGRRDVFPVIMGSDVSAITGSKPLLVLDGSAWAPAWSVGAYGSPHPRVTWGAAIVGRIDAKLEGPVQITYSDDAQSPGDMLIGRQTTTQLLPWTFQAGAHVDVSPNVELGGEVRYWLYRQYQRQHSDIVGIFLLRELDTPKNYRDSWQLSGGARVHDLPAAPKLELMAGLKYDRTPAPPETITLDQPSFSHYGFHVGARYPIGRYRIGLSYSHYRYIVPTITSSVTLPPSNIEGHGTMNIATLSLEAAL